MASSIHPEALPHRHTRRQLEPGRHCPPRHMTPLNSIIEARGFKMRWIAWRAAFTRPYRTSTHAASCGLADIARHVIGRRLTQASRVQDAVDGVVSSTYPGRRAASSAGGEPQEE